MTKVYEAFMQEVPQITVEMTPFRGQFDKVITAVAGGTAPDVVTISGSNVAQFGQKAVIQALDSRVGGSRIIRRDKFFPAQLEAASWNGKLFGIPAWEHGPSPLLFWNKAHFEEIGLHPEKGPTTLEEARVYTERLTKQAPAGRIERLGWEPLTEAGGSLLGYWAKAYNVNWYNPKTQKLDLLQPGLVAAVEYITAIHRRLTPQAIDEFRTQYPRWNSPQAGMAQGAESMKVSSYVSTGTLANNAPNQRIGIGWAPAEKPRQFIQLGGAWTVTLPTGAKQPDAGFRFMEYLTTAEANQLILDHIGWIGYNKEVAEKLNIEKVPNMRFVLDAPRKAKEVHAPIILPVGTGAVNTGLQRVIAGELSAREMLQGAQREIQAELDEALRT
jgi:multiple sugar transport system substrate-binding protein